MYFIDYANFQVRDRLKLKRANVTEKNASGNRFVLRLSSSKRVMVTVPSDAGGKVGFYFVFTLNAFCHPTDLVVTRH